MGTNKAEKSLRKKLLKLLSTDSDEETTKKFLQQLLEVKPTASNSTDVTPKSKRKRVSSSEEFEQRSYEKNSSTESDTSDADISFKSGKKTRTVVTEANEVQSEELKSQHNSDTSPTKPHDQVNKVFRESNTKLQDSEICEILKAADKGKCKKFIMDKAPVKPKAGQMFLCLSRGARDFSYRLDEYFGLKCRGANGASSTSNLYRWYVKYVNENDEVIPGFEKDEYCLRKRVKNENRIILVHYLGDEKVWKERPHGNSKTGKIFTPNRKDVREKAKKKLAETGKSTTKVYHSLLKEAAKEQDFQQREATIAPRDTKQIQNANQQLNAEKRILRDEFFSVYEMIRSKRLGGFLKLFMVPDEAFVLAEPEALRFASYLLQEAQDQSKLLPQSMTYDTTFCVLDGYVSALVMRNTCLQNNPIFPVAFLVHERRTEAAHDVFWREIVENLAPQGLPSTVPICTDREKAITNAIKKRLGDNVNLVFCNNHIKRDAKFWLQKCPGKGPTDVSILPKEVDTILQSRTSEEFDMNYAHFEATWSQPFREYMASNVKDDMRRYAAHFYTSTFPAFQNYDATNNAAESLNACIKREVDWKTLRIDSAILILFNMQLGFLKDFARSYASTGIGNFVLKPYYKSSKQPYKSPSYIHWDHQEFVNAFKDEVYKPHKNVEKEGNFLQSRSAIAKLACSMQYVSLNSQTAMYTVTDPYTGSRHSVEEENRKLKCTCPDTGVCFHKVAYLQVTKKDVVEDECTWSLSQLRKKTRTFQGRSGKKHLDREDFANVIEAPESQLAKDKMEMESFIDKEDSQLQDAKNVLELRKNRLNEIGKIVTVNAASSQQQNDSPDDGDDILNLDVNEGTDCAVSVSSDGKTPEEFSLSGFVVNTNKSLLNSPTYKCLKIGQMLMTDIVDDMIALLIKIHGLEGRVGFVNTYISSKSELADTTDNIEGLLRCALKMELLNNDVLLVNIRPTDVPHYVLGVILFQVREIIIVNSLQSCPSDSGIVISILFRLAAASFASASFDFDPLGWRVYNETECVQQNNGTDCGLHAILNVLSIVRKQPFYTKETLPTADLTRAWVLSCLTHKSVQRPVRLKRKTASGRLPVRLIPAMLDVMTNLSFNTLHAEDRSNYTNIRNQVREVRFDEGSCQLLSCPASFDYIGETILCVVCRMWMHLGMCVPTTSKTERFFCCNGCKASMLSSTNM